MMLFRCCVVALLLAGCSAGRMVETDLYFGQSMLNGDTLTAQQWNTFARQYICKILPAGCSILPVAGYWYDTTQHRLITEPSRIVVTVNKMTPYLSKQIDSLRSTYKTLYQQQSVLRTDKRVSIKLF